MGSLHWVRLARRLPGLSNQRELPNLEALIESEGQKPGDELRIASRIVPIVLPLIGCAVFIPLSLFVLQPLIWGAIGLTVLGIVIGLGLNALAKSITPTRAALRKRSRRLLERMARLRTIFGLEPALSPTVGIVLDEAARLYLKSCSSMEPAAETGLWAEARIKAEHALEDAMARMLELADPDSPQAQEIALSRGWAQTLLREMSELDRALEVHAQNARLASLTGTNQDALAGLRGAREELQRIETATAELELSDE